MTQTLAAAAASAACRSGRRATCATAIRRPAIPQTYPRLSALSATRTASPATAIRAIRLPNQGTEPDRPDHRSAARQPLQRHRPPPRSAMRQRGDEPGADPISRLRPRYGRLNQGYGQATAQRLRRAGDARDRDHRRPAPHQRASRQGPAQHRLCRQHGYGQATRTAITRSGDLTFRCNVDYRGAVTKT